MAGDSIERRRERRREGDELPRESEDLMETRIDEAVESPKPVEDRLREAFEDLAEQEDREERISQRLEEAFEDLRNEEKRKESTETRLREAIDSLEDDESGERKTEVSEGDIAPEVKSNHESRTPEEVSRPEREGTHVRFGEIRTQEEFDQACERYPELEYQKSTSEEISSARSYFEEIERGEDTAKPSIVQEIENREIRRMYETIHDGPPEVKIESMEDVEKLLQDYPEEREHSNFDERYRHCEVYFEVRGDFSIKRDDIAEKHKIGHGLAGNFRNGIEPTLIKDLRRNEEDKIIREWYESAPEIDEKTLEEFRQREKRFRLEGAEERSGVSEIDPQAIQEAAVHLKEKKNISVDQMTDALEHINKAPVNDNNRIRYADFSEVLSQEQIRQIEPTIRTKQHEIEKGLSKRMGLGEIRARIAVEDCRIYTWIPKSRPDELVDAYEKQFYYFKDRRDLSSVVEDLGNRLGIEGGKRESLKHLNEITRQLIHESHGETARVRPIDEKSTRLEGKVIRIYLDTSDSRLADLEGHVVKVTGINGQAGIENPHFPEGRNLEVLKARLAAIIASDCYLAESGRISYNEDNLERVAKVQEILRNFGDITLVPKLHHGVYESHIPNQIGLMMIHEGMTPGSKAIQNPGLPSNYTNWSEEARRAYLEELIPEEGSFSTHRGFAWNRNHAIYDEAEGGRHRFKSLISRREIQLIIDEGTQTKGLVPQYNLAYGKLEELQFNDDTNKSHSAKRLIEVIRNSSNNLIEDEKKIAESLGIQITLSSPMTRYYPKSERVSVRHSASTSTKKDAIRWGTICPPNDEYKRNKVEDWLRTLVEDWLDKKEWTDWFS